ncbi:hypothetical protein [Pararhodobacter oceanensis]|uniref:hypothetical protein n=1 Tax=Pararhodobacter oceanensis TaxID=2172121 RepID=UPI003A8DFE87
MARDPQGIAQLRQVLSQLYDGNFAPFEAARADSYTLHVPGQSRIAGRYQGAAETTRFIATLSDLSGGSFAVTLTAEICISGNWAMVPLRVTAEVGDLRLDMPAFGIWRFDGAEIVEHWTLHMDQYAFDRFVAAAEAPLP